MTDKPFTEHMRRKLFGIDPQGHITIPDDYTRIGDFAFLECTSLSSVTIPDSVTSIGGRAFFNCTNLKSITIPDSIIRIRNEAFGYCTSLTNITISNSVTSIEPATFSNCTGLTNVTIPNSVTSIGDYAFCDCESLINITIPNSVKSIGYCAFGHCENLKTRKANYKAFEIVNKNELLCRGYEYFPNKWSDKLDNIKLCKSGFHFCTNLFEIFNYYYGKLDKEIAIYECEVGNCVVQDIYSSKCVTNMIKPVKKLYKDDIIKILNG